MSKTIMLWSGGKDSSMAYYEAQKTQGLEISALLTTVTEGYDRISMHGVRCILLEQRPNLSVSRLKRYIFHKSLLMQSMN